MRHTKIAIVGAGAVGASCAYSILWKNITAEIMLVDVSETRCKGEVLDLSDAIPFTCTSCLHTATFQEAGQADIIIICAGARQKPGQSRTELLETNVTIVKSIIKSMQPINKQAIIIMVTNPVDVMAYVAQHISGLPKEQVIGSGTWLDTQRLRNAIACKVGVSCKSIDIFMLGEHGNTQFAAWSCATIGSVPIIQYPGLTPAQREKLEGDTKNLVYTIIECKDATYYGIGACIADICECIIFNQKRVLPLSSYINEFKVSISMPVVLGEHGIEKIMPIPLDIHEKTLLKQSVEQLQALVTT